MRILALLSIILTIFLSQSIVFAKVDNTEKIFALIKQKEWKEAHELALKSNNSALTKIVDSQKYLDTRRKSNKFENVTKFLINNPGWPQSYSLRVRAEGYIDENTDKKQIVSWFSKNKPLTGEGYKYYALAAVALVQEEGKEELIKIIKDAWHYGDFSSEEQKVFYKNFSKYLTIEDHVKKIDHHLWQREVSAAKRSLNLVNAGYKRSFNAQIDLIYGRSNPSAIFHKVPKKYYTPGLIYRYLEARKRNAPSSSEIVGLIRIVQENQDYSERFWKVQSFIAREFIEKKKYRDAYKVASSCFTEDAGDRSDAEFLSGWLALRFLKKPTLAARHFRNFNNIVSTPISKSRGIYWLARAHEDLKDTEKANRLYKMAASDYAYTFYGQMAAMELGMKQVSFPSDVNVRVHKNLNTTPEQKNDLFRAAKLVAKYGSGGLARTYIKEIVRQAETPEDVLAITNIIKSADNLHHTAWAAKTALQKHVFIQDYAYPTPYKVEHLPLEPALTYSIIRQESVFDQYAVSSAQARGLMQVIRSTACDTAKKIQERCRISRLTADPAYNKKIGTHYLRDMIEEYGGSYILAIASYNAGPHNVDKWIEIYGDPRKLKSPRQVLDWLESIPFYETRNYVQRVLENLQIYRAILSKDKEFKLASDLKK